MLILSSCISLKTILQANVVKGADQTHKQSYQSTQLMNDKKYERLKKNEPEPQKNKDSIYGLIVENDKKRLRELEGELDDNIEKFRSLGLSLG